jgi:galactokinase
MALAGPGFGATEAEAVAADYAARFGARPDVLPMGVGPGATVL